MCKNVLNIEKTAEYRREFKRIVKGLVRSKLFINDDMKMSVKINKTYYKNTKVGKIDVQFYAMPGIVANFVAKVTTRVYNTIEDDFIDVISEQLSKAKNFNGLINKGIDAIVVKDEICVDDAE